MVWALYDLWHVYIELDSLAFMPGAWMLFGHDRDESDAVYLPATS